MVVGVDNRGAMSYISGEDLHYCSAHLFDSGDKKPHWWSAVGGGVRSRRNA